MAQELRPISDILQATEVFVKRYMRQYDSSHDWTHIERVLRLAEHIARSEQPQNSKGYDLNVVKLAALLHDVGDAKYAKSDDPPDPVRRFLLTAGASDGLADTVQTITDRVSFSKEKNDPGGVLQVFIVHPELGAVQDADRLDAIGAIGIGRCFTFGAAAQERRRNINQKSNEPAEPRFYFENGGKMSKEDAPESERLPACMGYIPTKH